MKRKTRLLIAPLPILLLLIFMLRPELIIDRYIIAKNAIEKAPKLIPIYGHRYIPDTPAEIDNPIFSVYQTDIVYYGRNLNEYMENEFGIIIFGERHFQITEPIKSIPFWSNLVNDIDEKVDDGEVKKHHS